MPFINPFALFNRSRRRSTGGGHGKTLQLKEEALKCALRRIEKGSVVFETPGMRSSLRRKKRRETRKAKRGQ